MSYSLKSLLDYTYYAYTVKDSPNLLSILKGNFFSFKYTQGFYFINKDDLIIGISGTKNLDHWLTNLKVHRRPFKPSIFATFIYSAFNLNPTVHSGFYRAAELIYRELRDKDLLNSNVLSPYSRIIICGHSQGGAIGSLLSQLIGNHLLRDAYTDLLADKHRNNKKTITVFRVGCPKIGDLDYTLTELKVPFGDYISYNIKLDIVPNLPLRGYCNNRNTHKLDMSWNSLDRSHSLDTYRNIILNQERKNVYSYSN